MFSDVDETIKTILIKKGGFEPAEIDVSFEIPNREWSAGIARPTLNCYLFDIRENRDLSQMGMFNLPASKHSGAALRRPPMRLDLTYLITAWTREVEDEHRLLWNAFVTMFRFNAFPEELQVGMLREHNLPIYTSIAQADTVLKSPGDFWTALENQLKPSLSFVVSLAIERDLLSAGPLVNTRVMRLRRSSAADEAASRGVQEGSAVDVATTYQIRGVVRNRVEAELANVVVRIADRALPGFTTDGSGRFSFSGLQDGPLTLIVSRAGREIARRETSIPSPDYTIVVDED